MKDHNLENLLSIIEQLKNAKIFFSIAVTRDDAITIHAAVPGQRWEIDVFADGETQLEVFRSEGEILGHGCLRDLIAEFTD